MDQLGDHDVSAASQLQASASTKEATRVCELGDVQYWEAFYANELEQFEENPEVLEDWFQRWTRPHLGRWLQQTAGCDVERLRLLDVGCGNGEFLRELAHKYGFRRLYGFDASIYGVRVAKRSFVQLWDESVRKEVQLDLQVSDVLTYSPPTSDGHVEIVHDKGTLDAILLSGDMAKVHAYIGRCIFEWLNPNKNKSMLVITSCNCTAAELEHLVMSVFKSHWRDASDQGGSPGCVLRCLEEVPRYRELQYGGQRGSAVVTSAWTWQSPGDIIIKSPTSV
jgi:SAM-dependent methyltransferase